MYYFSISSQDNIYLGFMVLMDENNSDAIQGNNGYLAIKTVEEKPNSLPEYQILFNLSQQPLILWHKTNQWIEVTYADGTYIGKLQQQFFIVDQYHFLLEDLTGTV